MPLVEALNTQSGEIKLTYVFKGACDTCSSAVETLEQDISIDNKDHHFVIAYCLHCKTQLNTREVVRLDK